MAPGRLVPVVVAVALTLGCARQPSLPPKAGPEEVRLYDPGEGEYPEPGYTTIGPVTVRRPAGTPRPELIRALRAEAARLGADGVILQRIGREDAGAKALIVAEGLALHYPEESDA